MLNNGHYELCHATEEEMPVFDNDDLALVCWTLLPAARTWKIPPCASLNSANQVQLNRYLIKTEQI